MPPGKPSDKNYWSEIFNQTVFSKAAFVIEHPDQANDRDALLERRNKGELRAFVAEATTTKCKSKPYHSEHERLNGMRQAFEFGGLAVHPEIVSHLLVSLVHHHHGDTAVRIQEAG